MKRCLLASALILSVPAHASTGPSNRKAPSVSKAFRAPSRWKLGDYLSLVHDDPSRLIRLGRALFSEDRLRRASTDAKLVFEWQDRLALLGALTGFFDPVHEKRLDSTKARYRDEARKLLVRGLLDDTSLIVRDGAVEAIRRVQRMQPGLNRQWAKPLERAFFDDRNSIEGEGLFIRETILTTLREGSLPLTNAVRRAASRDRNPQVRELLRAWDTSAYQKL